MDENDHNRHEEISNSEAVHSWTRVVEANGNKSTASGAKYARSSEIFPHRMAFVRGVVPVKRGPKLNRIKKNWVKRGGGGANPTTLTVSSLVSEF